MKGTRLYLNVLGEEPHFLTLNFVGLVMAKVAEARMHVRQLS